LATLRKWDKQGILLPMRLPSSGQRMYRVEDVEELIEKLRE
jgi:DNA-binding transcriptional MerR regulator